MAPIFDLDALSKPDWAEALGRRVFPFEAFLSHNRFDQSGDVALKLRCRGLSVWHDEHADMEDRKVQSKVAQAIKASRYLVVCVGPGFRDSPWVRAEYRPARAVERRGGLTRVVVLRMDGGASVPEELTDSPLFAEADLDGLAAFLQAGNLLPADTEAVLACARERLDGTLALLKESFPITKPTEGSDVAAELRRILHAKGTELEEEAGGAEFSPRLFHIRNLVVEFPQSLPPPSSRAGMVLRQLAVRLCRSLDTDNRANGAMLLRALDERWANADTLSDLLACLCLERNSSVIDTVIEHLPTVSQRATSADLDTMSVLALRTPRTFFGGRFLDLVASLPEAVRCRVQVREALGGLSPTEGLSLIRERLTFTLARLMDGGSAFADSLGAAGPLLSITDLELLVRGTCEILRIRPKDEVFPAEVSADQPLLDSALRIIEQIATPSSEGHRAAIYAMAEQVLDFLLVPLTLYRPLPDLWPRARETAERLCDVLANSDKVGEEVPCYRLLIEEIDAGDSVADARARLTFCLVRK